MIYQFDDFELDLDAMELRHNGSVLAIEPQVFDLLRLLIENRDRMVSKQEIFDTIWNGRVVTDSAMSSRIKSARHLLGDSGETQQIIKTIRGRGFRFVAEVHCPESSQPIVTTIEPASGVEDQEILTPAEAQRPSVAVLPFQWLGEPSRESIMADALPHELIVALSRLRWLAVIARGSTFQFRSGQSDHRDVGRALNVHYCVSGLIEQRLGVVIVTIDLSDTRDGRLVWGDRFEFQADQIHDIRANIIGHIITALEVYIPQNEASLARLKSPESLDAWAEYHLGLQAMYRFNPQDNAAADVHFRRAISLDPGFARAHAGLSFTRFQDVFLNYAGNPDSIVRQAIDHAEHSVHLDPHDPFTNFNLGRAHLLHQNFETSLSWLDRSIQLSPNYAQGLYSRGWIEAIASSAISGRDYIDQAMRLSPLDPLMYAMMGTRALTYLELDDFETAASWAEKAAGAPQSHVFLGYFAIVAHSMAGHEARAEYWAKNVKNRRPDIGREHFFHAFPFQNPKLFDAFDLQLKKFKL